jgi:HPt (histidine-containing phosphotransfer) domain-containing protein
VDPSALEQLRRLGGDRLACRLGGMFLELTPGRLGRAREGLRSGDTGAVRHEAHALKGSSGQIGAVAVYALCREIESLASAQALEAVVPLLDALDQEFARFRGWLCDTMGAP